MSSIATPTPVLLVTKRAPKRVAVAPPKPAKPARHRKLNLVQIRERLLEKKTEILNLYHKDLRSGQESNDSPTEDIVDRANNAYSRELSFSISDAERTRLIEIDEALQRLELGTYGRCAHCGQVISGARITAVAWAKHCVDCQELLEQGMLPEA